MNAATPTRRALRPGWSLPSPPYPGAIPTAYCNQGYAFLYWPTRFGEEYPIPWPYEGPENVGPPEAFMLLGFTVEDLELTKGGA